MNCWFNDCITVMAYKKLRIHNLIGNQIKARFEDCWMGHFCHIVLFVSYQPWASTKMKWFQPIIISSLTTFQDLIWSLLWQSCNNLLISILFSDLGTQSSTWFQPFVVQQEHTSIYQGIKQRIHYSGLWYVILWFLILKIQFG